MAPHLWALGAIVSPWTFKHEVVLSVLTLSSPPKKFLLTMVWKIGKQYSGRGSGWSFQKHWVEKWGATEYLNRWKVTKTIKRTGHWWCGIWAKRAPTQATEGIVIKSLELAIKASAQRKAADWHAEVLSVCNWPCLSSPAWLWSRECRLKS